VSFIRYFALSGDLAARLHAIIAAVPERLRRASPSEAIALIERLGREQLPHSDPLVAAVRAVTEPGAEAAAVLVTGTEFLRGLGPTPVSRPTRRDFDLKDLDVVRVAVLGAAGKVAYAYSDQADGLLCDDVTPLPDQRHTPGVSYGRSVGWHTEDAPFARDELNTAFDTFSMAYLRNPGNDPTLLSKLEPALLSSEARARLATPFFKFLTSLAHQGDKNGIDAPLSILYERDGAFRMRFTFARLEEQRVYYDGLGLRSTLDEFERMLAQNELAVESVPGNVLFFDNTRVAHRRGEFRTPPRFDGTDRWQKRLGAADAARFALFAELAEQAEPRILESAGVTRALRASSARSRTPSVA
jgi:hypothetical protein